MNTQIFRHFYAYHFAENRKTWDWYVTSLSFEQFTHAESDADWSVRDHLLHLISVDDGWFSELRGVAPSEPFSVADNDDRSAIRAYWDGIEQTMSAYLATLSDDMLFEQPITEPEEDKDLIVWQVLLHVVNHGTDHRAQLLKLLNSMGVRTAPQDYMFYVYDHP